MNEQNSKTGTGKAGLWVGRILTFLLAGLFVMSAIMKLVGGPELEKGLSHLGIPMTLVTQLAILELLCVTVYLIPQTAVIGAILLTGYMGGAICSHWRVGDPVYVHCAIGVLVWLSVCLRDPRLWSLMPVRSLKG